ncbi:MAG: PssD/Cps14F family polysaccharide biosynthesis glycosyltransferase [Streptosporangiaceae bacterium]
MGEGKSAVKVLLVCSSGGHLAQLYRLRPWWSRHERVWVTFGHPQAVSLLRGEGMVPAFSPTTRNIPNAARNLRLAIKVIRAERPDVVISDGAGLAFPFFIVARLLGVHTVYLEVYDRITRPTLTGRLCYPLSSLFLVQWPEQAISYPRGKLIGCLL